MAEKKNTVLLFTWKEQAEINKKQQQNIYLFIHLYLNGNSKKREDTILCEIERKRGPHRFKLAAIDTYN